MEILRRSFAPISAKGWAEIDEMARQVLVANLSARRFVDVSGPFGLDYPCVPVGRLNVPEKQDPKGVCYGVHQVLPLIEARVNFSLRQWELDNLERGAKDVELDGLVDAARKMAAFEEGAIYGGFDAACLRGIQQCLAGKPIALPADVHGSIDAVSEAQARLTAAGIEGASALVVCPDLWKFMARNTQGGTLRSLLATQVGGPVVYSQAVQGALLVSLRGGDLELTLGQDLSIGYSNHDSQSVHLYMTESFTFRVVAPEAMVGFKVQ